MDITLNKAQKDIAKEARRFLSKECPFDYVQEMYADEKGFTDDIWEKMTEMDWIKSASEKPDFHSTYSLDLI